MISEDTKRMEALCRRLEKALGLATRPLRCVSGAHMVDDTCRCTGLPRLEALVDLLLGRPSSSTAPRAMPTIAPDDGRSPSPFDHYAAVLEHAHPALPAGAYFAACPACDAAKVAPAPRQPSGPARDPLCKCLWSPVSPAGRIMCDHCRRAADTNGGTDR